MMVFDSALMIFMAEALAVLIVSILGIWFFFRRKRSREFAAINQFIDQLDEAAELKNKPLSQLLNNGCGLSEAQIESVLLEITESERALFQRVIQLFLQREMTLLPEIDQSIGSLSEPYCRVIGNMASHHSQGGGTSSNDDNSHAGALERINQQLVRQLDTAMQTIDEITAEYTRVFSGQQSALELDNSRKKMLQIFQDAEQQIKQNLQEPS